MCKRGVAQGLRGESGGGPSGAAVYPYGWENRLVASKDGLLWISCTPRAPGEADAARPGLVGAVPAGQEPAAALRGRPARGAGVPRQLRAVGDGAVRGRVHHRVGPLPLAVGRVVLRPARAPLGKHAARLPPRGEAYVLLAVGAGHLLAQHLDDGPQLGLRANELDVHLVDELTVVRRGMRDLELLAEVDVDDEGGAGNRFPLQASRWLDDQEVVPEVVEAV
mmetsp:Transcript_23287/g.55741  ORF Transcript_23287/g.55741 Transcript_23287/m.55741 type:complete len:222 (-) Transcript_23287:930-1595(-)